MKLFELATCALYAFHVFAAVLVGATVLVGTLEKVGCWTCV
jgi:hypothetical protein